MEEADPAGVRGAELWEQMKWSGVERWAGLKCRRVLYSRAVQFHTPECRLSFVALPFQLLACACASNTPNTL